MSSIAVLAVLGTFSSCSWQHPVRSSDETATSRRADHLEGIREAIARSDVRITAVDPVDQSLSGVTVRYGVTLFVRGAEPLRPETLRAVISAIESHSRAPDWTVILFVVDDADLHPVDATLAAETLYPDGWVTIESQLAISSPRSLFEHDR